MKREREARENSETHELFSYWLCVSWFSRASRSIKELKGIKAMTGFAFIPGGGGVEINHNKKLTYRLFQFDLLYTSLGNGVGQLNPRVSTGVVFNIRK